MFIGPVLTCISTVWRPRFRYDVIRTEFIKLQRLGCLAITGAMKMNPAATLGFLLGLPLLHLGGDPGGDPHTNVYPTLET